MFGKRVSFFKLLGFEVKIDMSWIIILVLVVWSLSSGYFPSRFQTLSPRDYWIMGVLAAAGLFLSIIIHEFSHSLVARKFDIPMKGITLFIFGGVAEMEEEPPTPRSELLMSIAGPISSIAIAAVLFLLYLAGNTMGWPLTVTGVLAYLAFINFLLAAFNLIPAFPLDGGRVLRSLLWGWKNNLKWATRVSSRIGSGFGIFLIVLGVLNVLKGNFIGGMWWFLIGMFLQNAAKGSYQQLLTRSALEGELVSRFMTSELLTVSPRMTVGELVEDYVYRHHFKMFPVVDRGKLLGCVSTRQVREVPHEEWERTKVGDILTACSGENTIPPDSDALKALSLMSQTGQSRLMVTKDGKLVGIIALKDLLGFLSLKIELEE